MHSSQWAAPHSAVEKGDISSYTQSQQRSCAERCLNPSKLRRIRVMGIITIGSHTMAVEVAFTRDSHIMLAGDGACAMSSSGELVSPGHLFGHLRSNNIHSKDRCTQRIIHHAHMPNKSTKRLSSTALEGVSSMYSANVMMKHKPRLQAQAGNGNSARNSAEFA